LRLQTVAGAGEERRCTATTRRVDPREAHTFLLLDCRFLLFSANHQNRFNRADVTSLDKTRGRRVLHLGRPIIRVHLLTAVIPGTAQRKKHTFILPRLTSFPFVICKIELRCLTLCNHRLNTIRYMVIALHYRARCIHPRRWHAALNCCCNPHILSDDTNETLQYESNPVPVPQSLSW
jgi:hypothetical protein